MNDAHWHLVINHFPIIIPVIGSLVLIGGFVLKSDVIKRTAYVLFALGAILAYPSKYTGEGAEEIAEKINGVTKKMIHNHEEIAETFAKLSYLLGGLSLLALWTNWKQKSFANIVGIIVLVSAMFALYYAKQTGTSGGEIRHTEIRADYKAVGRSTG